MTCNSAFPAAPPRAGPLGHRPGRRQLQRAQTPPEPGASERIDAIRKAGVLRVGVVNNPPWLVQNTSGSGEPWMGSSWTLGKSSPSCWA